LKYTPELAPVEPAPVPTAAAPAPAAAPRPTPAAGARPAAVPGLPLPEGKPKQRPPVVLRLPLEKGSHFPEYAALVAQRALVNEVPFVRGSSRQVAEWDQNLKPGGANGMSAATYARGQALGLDPPDILRPPWTRLGNSIPTEVDHIIELQVTPAAQRGVYDAFQNLELLDAGSNESAGSRLQQNIARERAQQAAFDPALATAPLVFERVERDGGNPPAVVWPAIDVANGEHLDVYEGKK